MAKISKFKLAKIKVTASTSFVPTERDGTTTLTFEIANTSLAGKTIVVFNALKKTNGPELTSHTELHDEDCTIHYPAMTAKQSETEQGTVIAHINNLTRGKTYRLRMGMHVQTFDKHNNGEIACNNKMLRAEKEFVAAATSVDVPISVSKKDVENASTYFDLYLDRRSDYDTNLYERTGINFSTMNAMALDSSFYWSWNGNIRNVSIKNI